MGTKRQLKLRLALRLVSGSGLLRSLLDNADRAIESCVGTALRSLLSNADKEALSIALYDESFNPDTDLDGLYPWERRWYVRRLPAPPARILLGAAGSGREAVVLERFGYTVVALEPSKRAAAHCRSMLGPDSTVLRASYGDLTAAVLDDVDSGLALTRHDRFDAVLLGWGSFGHVLRREDRFRLLRACHALCPAGPILLSVFVPPRAPPAVPEGHLDFLSWGGFLAHPSAEEIAAHGKSLGREPIASLDNSSPYFTLVPHATATDAHTNRGRRATVRPKTGRRS